MFKHQTAADESISAWTHFRTLIVSVEPAPCHCITPAGDRGEVWISCGNNLRVLNLSDRLFDPLVIHVPSDDDSDCDNEIRGVCYREGSIWCFLDNSCRILRYDAASRALVNEFYCGDGSLCHGDNLSNDIESMAQASGDGDNFSNGIDKISCEAMDQDQSAKHRYAERAKVTAILIIEDTIWIGRSHGGILSVYVGENDDEFGEVLAVFAGKVETSGYTTHLLDVGCDRVLECQSVATAGSPFRHHLLLWEKWKRQDIEDASALTIISRLQEDGTSDMPSISRLEDPVSGMPSISRLEDTVSGMPSISRIEDGASAMSSLYMYSPHMRKSDSL